VSVAASSIWISSHRATIRCLTYPFSDCSKTTRDTLFDPRYVYNIFQTCNTFLRANAFLFAGEILGQLGYEEKEVKPYKPHELKALFQAADDEEKVWMSYFLNTGCREQEVANAEYCDLLDDVNVVWVRSKPHRSFKLKGKRWQNTRCFA
jgi:integrase